MAYNSRPSIAGFLDFIRNVMAINDTILPDTSPVISMALSVALAIVNPALNAVGYTPGIEGTVPVSIYTLAVYNLAGDNLINYAPDLGSPPPVYLDGLPFFAYMRQQFNTSGFVSGVIQSAADESTSESMVVMEAAKNFTFANLQNMKTPWGRTYLGFAQAYGDIVGIS